MGNALLNELLHFCFAGINKIADNICGLSPDLLAEVVSIGYLKLLKKKRQLSIQHSPCIDLFDYPRHMCFMLHTSSF